MLCLLLSSFRDLSSQSITKLAHPAAHTAANFAYEFKVDSFVGIDISLLHFSAHLDRLNEVFLHLTVLSPDLGLVLLLSNHLRWGFDASGPLRGGLTPVYLLPLFVIFDELLVGLDLALGDLAVRLLQHLDWAVVHRVLLDHHLLAGRVYVVVEETAPFSLLLQLVEILAIEAAERSAVVSKSLLDVKGLLQEALLHFLLA